MGALIRVGTLLNWCKLKGQNLPIKSLSETWALYIVVHMGGG